MWYEQDHVICLTFDLQISKWVERGSREVWENDDYITMTLCIPVVCYNNITRDEQGLYFTVEWEQEANQITIGIILDLPLSFEPSLLSPDCLTKTLLLRISPDAGGIEMAMAVCCKHSVSATLFIFGVLNLLLIGHPLCSNGQHVFFKQKKKSSSTCNIMAGYIFTERY